MTDLVGPLQGAIARADPTWLSQPSHLRRRLVEELGPDARLHRAQIHQLVVAAEERVPARLKRGGWSPEARAELGQLLVSGRGWTSEAADWTVQTWAAALGLSTERPDLPSPVDFPSSGRPAIAEPPPTAGATAIASVIERPPHGIPLATELPPSLVASSASRSEGVAAATELPPAAPHPSLPAPSQPAAPGSAPAGAGKRAAPAP